MSIRSKIKKFIPSPILLPLQNLHSRIEKKKEARMIAKQSELHRKAVERIRAKQDPINVVFFALMDSVWKYDILYQLMEKDDRFNPIILVCPIVNYGRENMLLNMNNSYNLFTQRGYNVIRSYDVEADKYVDVRSELSPDIIFYTNPYNFLIDDRYYINNFLDILTIYVNYNFPNAKSQDFNYGLLLHNLVWRRYVETKGELNIANSYPKNLNQNARYTGYPGIDVFLNEQARFKNEWKIKDTDVKRIIWAPHHTITEYAAVFYSTFLEYCEFMFEMAEKYEEKIQICFKPHPLLKNRLGILWGEDKTHNYYKRWENLSNGMLNDGNYEDLFLTSDAILHDCGSFIGEYLYSRNPAMYLSNGRPFLEQYNELANRCLENYYIGKSREDIERFIVNVINGVDPLKEQREEFFHRELLPPNGKLASENILDDIIRELRPTKS